MAAARDIIVFIAMEILNVRCRLGHIELESPVQNNILFYHSQLGRLNGPSFAGKDFIFPEI